MQSYHDSDLAQLASFSELRAFVVAREEEPGSFEDFERQLGERMRAVENELKAFQLARYDVDAQVIQIGGQEFRRCLKEEPKTYLSASGPVTVARNLFRPSGGGKSVCALDLRAGIVGGVCTPVLARQVSYAMGHMTSGETADLFVELGVEGPSSSTCDRIPKAVGKAWERNREEWEAALREQETIPGEAAVMAVSLTASWFPTRTRSARRRPSERRRRRT